MLFFYWIRPFYLIKKVDMYWKLPEAGLQLSTRNVIAVIVAMGLVIVPALYAWYNIAASWDPYGNTKALKVAVANVDKGYKSDLMPITINVGETVTNTLRANHDLDWQFVDRAKAIDGVNSGEYYAALIIPKSFSSDMMTLFSPKIKHAKLEYYLNEKINPIAPHITDQGATTVATTIDQTFVKTLASVALDLVSNVADYAQSPQMEQYVNNASSHIATMSSRLTGTASQMDSYANLLGAANSIIDSTDKLLGYRFEAVDRTSGAPIYIEFNDHMIESAAPEHFHIRMSNESFDAIVDPEKSWPTFFPADMTGEDLCEHMEGHGHDHEEEADEHAWLSLKNAKILVGAISNALQELDPDNKDTYAANAAAYIEKLSTLDGAYQSAVDGAAHKTVLFGDRFPFRYLVDDYGLGYYAAFAGCSAESEASFEMVSFLAKKVDELGLPCVLTIEGKNHKLAETIVQSTAGKNQKVLTMDSMQSMTSKDVANGATYLSVMEQNLSVLKEALG